jgi:hypothetical protein
MRIAALVLFWLSVSGGGAALAQSEPAAPQRAEDSPRQESPEEVVVRGKRVGQLRAEVDEARQRAYDVYNEINSNDEFDVRCRKERRTGSNVATQVCRPRFEDEISAAAASAYASTLFQRCQPDAASGFLDTQACMFSEPGVSAKASAQGVETQSLPKHEQMAEEISRLAREDDRLAEAIFGFYEASQEYEAARKRRND